ncbi:hypothetical protein [Chitinophaga sp. Cy-1792]|uniref:hypothetical protein n=1 Tax=Chitinophaga sp. Cy-1792 TaxID=2608339 RepID=UPI00141DF9BF|nr:hypothetical protein [Chitinophaga sp. Cy-1792]NIG54047.1 outer membrane beta-barrel protein [Chitinophaga sp. Cy-1792]
MNIIRLITVPTLLLCFSFKLYAQQKDSSAVITNAGKATGLVFDQQHHHVMQAATVSIYLAENAKLLRFQLTNNWGKFNIDNLPVGKPLRLVASNVGYKSATKDFIITDTIKPHSFDTIVVERQTTTLKEVVITEAPPPIQMRGDTLEFNSAAFKLDTNAVVGDLLRKLPGVTVWGDGAITVNGKKVSKLFVEGKEFFGGNPNIALNNLAKDAVKKIQVYEDKSIPDKVDKNTYMNVVLGKDKKDGYFGKIGIGRGTGQHTDATGMMNYFSPKSQVTVGGVYNNVNKTAGNLEALTEQASFQTDEARNQYLADFRKPGKTTFSAFGATAAYDFEDHISNPADSNLLQANYYFHNGNTDITQATQSATKIDANSTRYQNSNFINHNNADNHAINGNYQRKKDYVTFTADVDVNYSNTGMHVMQQDSTFNAANTLKSNSFDQQDSKAERTNATGEFSLNTKRYWTGNGSVPHSTDMDLTYTFNRQTSNNTNTHQNTFLSDDSAANRKIDRLYQLKSTINSHVIKSVIKGFNKRWRYYPFVDIDILNQLSFQQNDNNNIVSDNQQGKYQVYEALTNINRERKWDYQTGLNIGKTITKRWAGSYRKDLTINLTGKVQFFNLDNSSQKDFQQISRFYSYFIPAVNINRIFDRTGLFTKSYFFNYNTTVRFPTLQELVPLVDDINVYYVETGNTRLTPAYTHNLSFTYHFNNKSPNEFRNDLQAGAVFTKHVITGNDYIDSLGRSNHHLINADGSNSYRLNDHFAKAFKLGNSQFQWSTGISFNYSETPAVLNGVSYKYKSLFSIFSTDLAYDFNDILKVKIGEQYQNSQSKQHDLYHYNTKNLVLFCNATLTVMHKLTLHTNADINSLTTNYTGNQVFTIWNADIAYRLLKGANAEIKFAALDLLHQNKNLINTAIGNTLSSQTVNTLQQYFMISVAYYPRMFGLKRKKG